MNSVNFRSLSSFFPEHLNPLLNSLQKKILVIAGLAILTLGLAYVLYTRRCFKAKITPAETSDPEKTDKLAQTKIAPDKEKSEGEPKKASAPAQPKQAKKQEEELSKKEETPKGPTSNPTPTPMPAQQFEGDAFNEEEIDELADAYVPPEDELSDLTEDAEVEEARTDEDLGAKPSKVDPKPSVPQPQKPQTNIEILEAIIPTLHTTHVKYDAKPLRGDQMGLPIADYHKSFIDVKKEVRYAVRDKTVAQLRQWLVLVDKGQVPSTGLPKTCQLTPAVVNGYLAAKYPQIRLFRDKTEDSDSAQLLGRFDVLATPIRMNYDAFWKEETGVEQKCFIMHSAAAINIGESDHAEDFNDFSTLDQATGERHLNELGYLKAMAKLFDHLLAAQESSGIKDAVWFPFGMGAFLRNLPKNDPTYKDPQQLYYLRADIAATFVEAAKLHPKLNIHLCLPTAEPGDEPTQNYNAFISALEASKTDIAKQFKVYVNVDAASLAQKLANQARDSTTVSLTNGANRNLLGNEWFGDYALKAIDENIYRRSFLAALTALPLNGGTEKRKRTVDELQQRVEGLKGLVSYF